MASAGVLGRRTSYKHTYSTYMRMYFVHEVEHVLMFDAMCEESLYIPAPDRARDRMESG